MHSRLIRPRDIILAGAIVLLALAISARYDRFVTPANLVNVYNDTAILIMLALAQTVVILTRGIDLSTAANVALTGMIVAMLNAAAPGAPIAVIVLLALMIGAVLGAFNGVLVWKLGIPPIVVTLGTLTIYRGLIFVIAGGAWINAHQMSAGFKDFPRAEFILPVLSWLSILVIVIMAVLLTRTALGRAFYAAGGNPNAAVYAGIDPGRTAFIAYVIAGALSGLCGYLWVSRYAVAYVDIANGFELDVIAACVIGGVSIMGGLGTVAGAVLGAIFLGVIKNALPVIDISPFWQMAISGSAIILAVAFNARAERSKGRVILKRAEAQA
ncbi:MAG TPA: ABC transporter permease [Pararhizobium sp.]|nr:ABC transporter permease [Pararhizobium sp.]